MRTINVSYTLYNYMELPSNIRENIRLDYGCSDIRGEDFNFLLKDSINSLFPNSLNSCQGDGVNVYGILDLKDISPEFDFSIFTTREIELPCNRFYSYCLIDQFNIYDTLCDILIDEDNIPSSLVSLENEIRTKIYDFCKEQELFGYEWFYEISDEEFEDIATSNGYEFYENSNLY